MKSFTLIEILITTTIILVFGGLSLAYYNTFNQEQNLTNEAQKLVSVFELAKKKAASGDLSGLTCNGGFNGYQVNVINSGYSLSLRCGGVSVSPMILSYSFPLSSNISVISGVGDYFFRELNIKIERSANQIVIKNYNISKCINIAISPVGIITVSNNLFPC